jgi:signal transduction histidine kinase
VKYPSHVGKVNPLSDGTILNLLGDCRETTAWPRDPVYIPDLLEVRDPWPALVRTIERGARSHLAALLVAGDRPIGVIHVMSPAPDAFTEEHRAILGEVASMVSVGLQQARLHDELRRHNAELEERIVERTRKLQEANAELDSFAYSVSHDLRAPLRALQGFSAILLDDDLSEEEKRDFTRRINGAAERMDTLIRDVLSFSRATRAEAEPSPVSLARVVKEALRQLEATIAESGARVVVEGELPLVRGHRTMLAQVVANLVSNAVKYVAPGVVPEVRVYAESRGGQVRLWVTDNGIGIASENQTRIFSAFERLHGMEEYPGSGIGLAIVKKGIERLGGTTWVESTLGVGSRFWIELPAADAAAGR